MSQFSYSDSALAWLGNKKAGAERSVFLGGLFDLMSMKTDSLIQSLPSDRAKNRLKFRSFAFSQFIITYEINLTN